MAVDYDASSVIELSGQQLSIAIRSDEVADVYRFLGSAADGKLSAGRAYR